MSTDRPFSKAFGAAAVAGFVLTVLPMLSGFSFDRVQAPYIIAGCLVAGLITGARAYFGRDRWSLRRIAIACFAAIGWMAVVLVGVMIYQSRQ